MQLDSSRQTTYHLSHMTAYTTRREQTTSQQVQIAREKRRKVLEAVKERRKIIYQRFQKKIQSHSHVVP
jgi:hypothetical protein